MSHPHSRLVGVTRCTIYVSADLSGKVLEYEEINPKALPALEGLIWASNYLSLDPGVVGTFIKV